MEKEWNNVANAWNENMKNGDWFQKNIIYPEIMRIIKHPKGKRILDVGCGNGHLSRYLSEKGAFTVGIDSSPKMIELCVAKRPTKDFVLCDITKNTPDYQLFDYAVFNNSLQDMPNFEKGIKNVYSVLKDSGELLIVVKHPCFHGRSEACGWRITTQDKRKFMTGYGLTMLEKNEANYTADFFMLDSYLNKAEHTREWYGQKTTSYARTLSDYINTVIRCGFRLEEISEPIPIKEGQNTNPSLYDLLLRVPNFIFIRGKK